MFARRSAHSTSSAKRRSVTSGARAIQRVALIGENGEGKTTLVKLLTRLYDPIEGQILLDGIDLREYDLDDLYREISVIFQDFMRYEMTARDNIAVGQIDQLRDLESLKLAAGKSMANEVIERLPRDYEQMLGRRFENGVDLSGGEWQKVALARAYLRDAQLLILDEPTAALDARSEFEVFQLLVAGITVSDIAARLNLSGKTVSTHKARLMEKLGLDNPADLVRYALRHHLADDDVAGG